MIEKPVVNKNGIRSPSIVDLRTDTRGLEPHEPIGGKNKKISEKEGLYIYVTRNYHTWLHSTEDGEFENARLKVEMQKEWIKHNNKSLHDFIKLFGKDYEEDYEFKMSNRKSGRIEKGWKIVD